MKNILKLMFVGVFTAFLIVSPLETSIAVNKDDSSNIDTTYSKTITNYIVSFDNVTSAPKTYFYNVNGWSGTLQLTYWHPTDYGVLASYSGVVSCTAPCIMSTPTETD